VNLKDQSDREDNGLVENRNRRSCRGLRRYQKQEGITPELRGKTGLENTVAGPPPLNQDGKEAQKELASRTDETN